MAHSGDSDAFGGFFVLLARLWRAKVYILVCGFVFAVLTYGNLRFLTPETFRSEAVLYLGDQMRPPTFRVLATNVDVIAQVRERFVEQFPEAGGISTLDRFANRFRLSSDILEDNSLRKVYSPAMVLTADAQSPEEARGLATIWVEELVERFGGASGLGMRFREEHTRKQLDQLAEKEKEAVARRSRLQHAALEKETKLTTILRILSPLDTGTREGDPGREFATFARGQDGGLRGVSINVPTRLAPLERGLIERRLEIRTELAKAEVLIGHHRKQARGEIEEPLPSANALETVVQETRANALRTVATLAAEIEGLRTEQAMVDQAIEELNEEMGTLTTSLSDIKADLAAVEADLGAIRLEQEYVGNSLAQASVTSYLSQRTGDGWTETPSGREGLRAEELPARLDFAVVARPALPDRRVAPARMVSAVMAAILGCLLACFAIAFAHLVGQLPRLSKSDSV